MKDDAAADPDHRGRADGPQPAEQIRHALDERAAGQAQRRGKATRPATDAPAPGRDRPLDDKRHDAVDRRRYADADEGEDDPLGHDIAGGDGGSVIAMIPAERMKSVLMALAIFPSSKVFASIATGSSFASWACAPWGKRNS